jgi:hypothetical protein
MVRLGLLERPTGTEKDPFEATYALTERGKHAAEYGECDFPSDMLITTPNHKHHARA